jgi:hypothetical protein
MRKPSAALVVASAALVMATIGTSVAATGYTITSPKQIKPGSISLASLSKSARKALHGARGPAGQDGQDGTDGQDGADGQDGQDGQDAGGLWAQIKADGSVNVASPGVTARNNGTGVYFVNFAQDITRCAAVATQASIPDFAGAGLSTTGITGAAFVAMNNAGANLAAGFPSQTSIRVETSRVNGTAVATSFTVAVFC